jgi:hypothetical protein
MLTNFFSKTNPVNALVLGILFCSLFFTSLFTKEAFFFSGTMVLKNAGSLLLNLLFLFLSGTALYKSKLDNGTVYASFILILFYGLFPSTFHSATPLLLLLLWMLMYLRILDLDRVMAPDRILFDVGLCVGVSFLFFKGALLLLIWIFLALVVFKKANLRNLLICFVGFSVPVWFFFIYCFFLENPILFHNLFVFEIGFDLGFYKSKVYAIPLLVCFSLNTLAVFAVLPKVLSRKTSFSRHYLLLVFMFFIGLGMVFLTSERNGSELSYLFLPSSVFIATFVYKTSKKWVKEFLLFGFAAFSVLWLLF